MKLMVGDRAISTAEDSDRPVRFFLHGMLILSSYQNRNPIFLISRCSLYAQGQR